MIWLLLSRYALLIVWCMVFVWCVPMHYSQVRCVKNRFRPPPEVPEKQRCDRSNSLVSSRCQVTSEDDTSTAKLKSQKPMTWDHLKSVEKSDEKYIEMIWNMPKSWQDLLDLNQIAHKFWLKKSHHGARTVSVTDSVAAAWHRGFRLRHFANKSEISNRKARLTSYMFQFGVAGLG